MSNFDEIKFQYAIYYKFIGLRVRGKLDPIGIFKEYWYGRRVDPLYYPSQPRTPEQQGQRTLMYDAVKNWQGFDGATKQYYNQLERKDQLYGYHRYLSFYLNANYPMIIYWEPQVQSATEPLTIPQYIAEPYFAGVQRIRTFADYPTSPPYGSLFQHSGYKSLFGFSEDIAWAAIPAAPAKLDYTEMWEVFAASGAGAWEEKDLTGLGVPANAVCEFVVVNKDASIQRIGGVRATDSAENRYFDLHEAEGDGVTPVSLHVKADADSKIDIYSQEVAEVDFYLVGYWS